MIVFVDPVCPSSYNSATLQSQAMGGTEATVVRVADGLSAQVAQHCRSDADGRYVPLDAITGARHMIVLRDPTAALRVHAQHAKARLYVWLHDLIDPGSTHARALTEASLELARRRATILCVSDFHRAQALEAVGDRFPAHAVRTIYNPITDVLQPRAAAHDPFKLVFASQPKKSLDVALAAFNFIHRHDRRYRLYVANPGYRKDERRTLEGVTWLGSLTHERMLAEIASALCVFYPNFSYPETFGLVFAESNALGTPVLTHNVGAAAEVLHVPSQLRPLHPALVTLYRWSRRVPRGALRRSTLALAGAVGAFDDYYRTVREWSEGGRPVVTGDERFRLDRVLACWRELLGETS